jgi:hypothetical protein
VTDFGAWEQELDNARKTTKRAGKMREATMKMKEATMTETPRRVTGAYKRTVEAALSESQSRFALAEALAIDIPQGKRGPKTVMERLDEAAKAITDAGGEERSAATLNAYRDTALWVSESHGSVRVFGWAEGASFTAHREAHENGLSYDKFAALKDKRTNAVLDAAGKEAKYPPARESVRRVRKEREKNPEADRAIRQDIMNEDKQAVTDVVAKEHGITPAEARMHLNSEIADLLPEAQEWALRNKSSVGEEAEAVISRRDKGRQVRRDQKERRDANRDLRYLELDAYIGQATKKLRLAAKIAPDVQWDDEHRELLAHELGKVRDMLGLLEMTVTGASQNDLDAEWEKFNEEDGG